MPDNTNLKEDFANWYRVFELGTDPELTEKRRAGVEKLAGQAANADVEALVRLAFKTKQAPSSEGLSAIRKAFKSVADSFPNQGNDRELQLLAGATLAEIFRRDGRATAVASLAVSTAAVAGGRRSGLPLDLPGAAEAAIAATSEARRLRPALAEGKQPEFPKADYDKAVTKLQGQQDWAGAAAALGLITEASMAAFKLMAKAQSASVGALRQYILIQDEELQMLWWLVGERSWDLDRSFASVPASERPLVHAKELATLTEILPGPPALRALLSRSGIKDQDTFTIPQVVNACDIDWLAPLVADAEPSPVTRPIHFAIKRKLETGDENSWVAGWSATTGLDATKSLGALLLATLFYRERLLVNAEEGST